MYVYGVIAGTILNDYSLNGREACAAFGVPVDLIAHAYKKIRNELLESCRGKAVYLRKYLADEILIVGCLIVIHIEIQT